MKIKYKRNIGALRPPAANQWIKMANTDFDCVGSMIQNQHNVANFWICDHLPNSKEDAIEFFPGAMEYDDKLPWQDELWVYTDTPGAALTFARIYQGE